MTIGANQWMRRRARTRIGSALAVAVSVAALIAPWLWPAAGDRHARGPVALGAAALLGCLLVATGGIWLARRLSRTGLWIGSESIVVRNPIRTWTVALDEVRAFALAPSHIPGERGAPVPVLCRRHGQPVDVWALRRHDGARHPSASELEPLCDGLNDVLHAIRRGQLR